MSFEGAWATLLDIIRESIARGKPMAESLLNLG